MQRSAETESEKLPCSKGSAASSGRSSERFSYWTHWSNMNKLGGYIIPSGGDSESRADLTEANLEFHNKLHGSIPRGAHINNYILSGASEKNLKCSPYYKGLTDSTLVLNRERGGGDGDGADGGKGGGSDSVMTSSTSSSLSSFAVKMQEFSSSCALFACGTAVSARRRPAATTPPAKIENNKKLIIFATDVEEKDEENEKPLRERKVVSGEEQKPLRERISLRSRSGGGDDQEKEGTCKSEEEERENKSESRFMWADMYRPKTLEDFICNRSKALWLKEKVKEGGCEHIIFQGPAGVGKRTMIQAMLREAFGDDKIQATSECMPISLKGEGIERIEVKIKKSAQHYEIKVRDLKGYEKHVMVELMKEIQMLNAADHSCECKGIVLLEADKLGTDALLYIKWLLERYKGNKKVFFSCSDDSKLQPLMPVCTLVQLLQPSRTETVQVLEFIAEKQGINLARKMAEKITDKSNNNLRQAIRSFEATWHASHLMEEDQELLTGWEDDIAILAKNIVDERTPRQLYIISGKLQNLIEHEVSPEFIFQFLVRELKKHLPNSMHAQLDTLYAEYTRDDKSMIDREKLFSGCRGHAEESGKAVHDRDPTIKNIHHFLRIEEFTAKFMSWYNNQSRKSDAAKELPS